MSDKIAKAKAQLILDQPFFAALLLGMPMSEDASIPTIGTNGQWIKYNAAFMETLSLPETVFILAHEVLHCALQQPYRRNGRDKEQWNIAMDYVVNDMLVKENVGKMPDGGLHNPALVAQGKGTSEGVYELIRTQQQKKNKPAPGAGQAGGALDEVSDGGADEAEQAANEADMKVRVSQAAAAAKMCGKLSQEMQRLVGELVKSRVDWKSVLRRFLTEKAKIDWTYAKPKRRFLAEEIYLPGLTGESLGEILVAVDCSGSVDAELLRVFGSELKGIVEDARPSRIHIVYFDSRVLRHDTLTAEEDLQLKAAGGGGTAFSPIFQYADKKGIQPAACVVLTDLQCSDFGPQPAYPVLWATTDAEQAPWGEVLRIKT